LADSIGWQVQAVRAAHGSGNVDAALVPVTPVLCFVAGEWPLLFPPSEFRGVRLEGTRSIKCLLTRPTVLAPAQAEEITRLLADTFPAA
jgi:hypothetical protein